MGFYKTLEIEYTLDDFSENNFGMEESKSKCYELKADSIIFHRLYDYSLLSINLEKDLVLSNYLQKINNYINWLGKKSKIIFNNFYNKKINFNNDDADFYTTFDCISLFINIDKSGNINTSITGLDAGNGWIHNEINLEDKTIISWEAGVNKYEK